MCQWEGKEAPVMVCWMRWEVRFHGVQRKCPRFYIRLVNWPSSVSPEDTASGSMVEDFTAVVRGGSSESITALLSKTLPTPQLMSLWGDGVRFNPDFIRTAVSFYFTNCCHTSPTFVCVSFMYVSLSTFELRAELQRGCLISSCGLVSD